MRSTLFISVFALVVGIFSHPCQAQSSPYNTQTPIDVHLGPNHCATPENPGDPKKPREAPLCCLNSDPDDPNRISYWVSKPGIYPAITGPGSKRCKLVIELSPSDPNSFIRPDDWRSGLPVPGEGVAPMTPTPQTQNRFWLHSIESNALLAPWFEFYDAPKVTIPTPTSLDPAFYLQEYQYQEYHNGEQANRVESFYLTHESAPDCTSPPLFSGHFVTGNEAHRVIEPHWAKTSLVIEDTRTFIISDSNNNTFNYGRSSGIYLEDPEAPPLQNLDIGLSFGLPYGPSVGLSFGIPFSPTPANWSNPGQTELLEYVESRSGNAFNMFQSHYVKIDIYSQVKALFKANGFIGSSLGNNRIRTASIRPPVPSTISGWTSPDFVMTAAGSPMPPPYERGKNRTLLLPRNGIIDFPKNRMISTIWNGCESGSGGTCFLIDLEGLLVDPTEITPQADLK